MLEKNDTGFIVVDVQGKLAEIVHESAVMMANLQKLIRGLRLLDIPIIVVEQYPEGLGPTRKELTDLLPGITPIAKRTFNACLNEKFAHTVKTLNRSQLLLAGIEAHVCLYQTAMGLKRSGFDVQVIEDATSSRAYDDKRIAIKKMETAGIVCSSTEIALFELMETSEGEVFKQFLQIVK